METPRRPIALLSLWRGWRLRRAQAHADWDAAWHAGRQADQDGQSEDACPFAGHQRKAWLDGYGYRGRAI